MKLHKITVAITTHNPSHVYRSLSFGICKDSQWDISLCAAEMANPELLGKVSVCVSEERGRSFLEVSCIPIRTTINNDIFFIHLEAFVDISFFSSLLQRYYQNQTTAASRKSQQGIPSLSIAGKLCLHLKIQPKKWQNFG